MTIIKDGRFPEFLDLIKKGRIASLEDSVKKWAEDIRLRFSIGSIRFLFRTQSIEVRYFVARCLYESVSSADEASRALSCWSRYDTASRAKLVGIMSASVEVVATNHSAYILTRARQTHWLSKDMYEFRASLIQCLNKRGDVDTIENALRWDEQFGSPLEQNERVLLKEMLKRHKKKGES